MSTQRFPHLLNHDTSSARKPAAETSSATAAAHPLLALQRSIGNAAVTRMLQALHDPALQRVGEEDEMQAKHDASLQREGEEDEMQAKHDASLQREGEEEPLQGKHDPSLQRVEEEEPLQGKHDTASPQVGLEGGAVGADISSAIESKRGGGASLDGSVRDRMEGAFNTSFADVRVHHDNESDALARSVTSKAFTTGSDVFLRGDTNPGDQSLLAHELTHVVQQRSMSGGGAMSVRPAGDQYEQEADKVADQVVNSPQRQVEIES